MDDTCAVCAETLEWTAYGPCGHKDVCSTCVARLRFICNDRRCCICKTESDFIFVTKALGDYTATISDFSVLPTQPKEGRAGSYWYHEDTQAFFDDVDHYRMIKAMCKLSCSVCENMDDQATDASKRRHRFRNIDQLKGHLFHQHKLLMCSLCLEGRKVFICEQKLYTRPQLNQHISTGDSEVDGDESDRGGFSGHPICEFCHTPFYGDNELYTHMSTEHYTCHICQRQHPGQYEYYKNYDDLEIHFRRDHFLCEDESCLAKKFIVFQSEAEFKRHNTLEHAGRMSRSKRSAALQIPTSFRYRRSNEQDNHRGRGGRTFRRDIADDDLSRAIEASLGSAASDDRYPGLTSSNGQTSANPGETGGVDPLSSAFESLAATDSDTPARYRQAVSQSSRNGSLSESSFPPLPVAPSQTRSNQNGALKNTMAARIRKQNARNLKASGADSARPVNSRMPTPAAGSPQPAWPVLNSGSGSSSGSSKPVADVRPAASNYLNPKHSRPAPVLEPSSTSSFPPSHTQNSWPTLSNSSGSSSASGPTKPAIANGSMPSSYSSSILAFPALSQDSLSETYGLSKNRGSKGKIGHSASAPNLDGSGSFSASAADFPPVSATQVKKLPLGNPINPKIEDVHTANKTLVERIQIALDFDEDRYTTFKDLSREYRQGLLDAETYMACVEQFGLSHLVPELAQLCPDAQKQKELMETYSAYIGGDGTRENGRRDSSHPSGSKDKKGKQVHAGNSNVAKENLADSIISTVRKLQSNYRPSEEDVETLTKDGYRSAKGKEKLVNVPRAEIDPPKESPRPPTAGGGGGGGSGQNVGDSDGRNKQQRKKTPKFLRVRLGDASAATLLDYSNSDQDPDSGLEEAASDGQNRAGEGLPVRGPWRNGGGQKLLASAKKK